MQSPPIEVPQGASPDLLLTATDRRRKHRDKSKEENEHVDKNVFYDIVSSPSKDSAKLTLKLSRVKVPDLNQAEELSPRLNVDSDHKTVILNNNNQLFSTPQDFPHKLEAEEEKNCQQVLVQPNSKETGIISVFDDSEIEALAEIDRIEPESAGERERCSKEVQDKGNILFVCLFAFISCLEVV